MYIIKQYNQPVVNIMLLVGFNEVITIFRRTGQKAVEGLKQLLGDRDGLRGDVHFGLNLNKT